MIVRRLATLTFVAAVMESCGGRTDSESRPDIRLGDFWKATASAACEHRVTCCEQYARPLDVERCRSEFALGLEQLNPIPPGKEDVRIPARCLDPIALAAETCGTWYTCAEVHEAIANRAKLGAPCSSTCFRDKGTITCGGNSPVDHAGACYSVDGLFCGPDGTCQAAAGVGSACSPEWGSCVNSFCSASHVCRPFLGEGADCGGAANGCADGLLCGSDSGACSSLSARAKIKCTCLRLKQDGESCRYPAECKYGSCVSGICGGPPDEKELDQLCPS